MNFQSKAGSSIWSVLLLTCILALLSFSVWKAVRPASFSAEGGSEMNNNVKTHAEWKKELTPLQYKVLCEKGTEPAGSGQYNKHYAKGTYLCAACKNELFASDDKFDSGSGWPSFSKPVKDENVDKEQDKSLGMVRTEVKCSNCDSHLGHVFSDGPESTGLRYCINSAALGFKPEDKAKTKTQTATFAAGCFWCTEAVLELQPGVTDVKAGYIGGKSKNPTYKDVTKGNTGHAEASQVTFNPDVMSYERLLDIFWNMHDPTTLNRQGADTGTQYRSAIFYHSEEQKKTAETSMKKYQEKLEDPIVTEITPASTFYIAEDYHQDYYNNNKNQPYCQAVIAPKLKKMKR